MLSISTNLQYEYEDHKDPTLLYKAICKRFKQNLTSTSDHLCSRLHEIKLVEEGSVEAYVKKIYQLISEMMFAGFAVPEEEKLFVIPKGLPTGWNPVRAVIQASPNTPTLEWTTNQLRNWELHLIKEENLTETALYTKATEVSKSQNSGCNGSRNSVKCTNCNRLGHPIEKCFSKGGGQESGPRRGRGRSNGQNTNQNSANLASRNQNQG